MNGLRVVRLARSSTRNANQMLLTKTVLDALHMPLRTLTRDWTVKASVL
jgi:hypothetical protein